MNKRQEATAKLFLDALLNQSSNGGRTAVEVKRFEISPTEYSNDVQLLVVVGLVGDEGTQAEIYCRQFRQVFIGPRGGISCRTVGRNGETKSVNINGFQESVWG